MGCVDLNQLAVPHFTLPDQQPAQRKEMTPERGAGAHLPDAGLGGVTSNFLLLRNNLPRDLLEILLAGMLKTRQWRCPIQVKDTDVTCIFHSTVRRKSS